MNTPHLKSVLRRRAPSCGALCALALFSASPLVQAQTSPAATPASAGPRGQTSAAADDSASDRDVTVLSPFQVSADNNEGYRATNTLAGSRINTPLKDVANAVTVVTGEFFNDVSAVDVNDILSYLAGTEGLNSYTATDNVLDSPDDISASNPQTSNRIRGLSAADIGRNYFYTVASRIGFDTYNLDSVTVNRGPNSVLFGQGSASGLINYSPRLANLVKNSTEVSLRFGSFEDKRATFDTNVVVRKNELAVRVAAAWNDHGFKQQPAHDRDKRFYIALQYKPTPKTTITTNFEHVSRDSRTPNSFTVADFITPYRAAGSPTVDLSTSPSPVDTQELMIFNKAGQYETSYRGMIAQGSIWAPPRVAGFYVPGLSDNRYFDQESVNMRNLNEEQKSNTFEFSIDQELIPKLFVNLAYFHEDYDSTIIGNFRTPYFALKVDEVSKLRNGAVNPHLGELYIDNVGFDSRWTNPAKNDIVRGTLTYALDLRKKHHLLGHYNLTGFAEERHTKVSGNIWNEVDPSNPTVQPNRRYYLGGSSTTPLTGRLQVPSLINNAADIRWDAATSTWVPGRFSTLYTGKRLQDDKVRLRSSAAVGQAYLLDDKLVGTVGIRRDKNGSRNRQIQNSDTLTGPYGDEAVVQKQTLSYGAVAHVLPWLSFHYNRSENFIPKAGNVDLLNNPTPSPEGTGRDYGVSFDLLDSKLNVKINRFTIKQKNDFPGQVVRVLAQWSLPYVEYGLMPTIANQLGVPYKYFNPSKNPGIGDGRLETGSYTADTAAKGTEVELTYNITKNWRLMANATKQEASRSNIAKGLTTIIDERLKYWATVPGLLTTKAVGDPWGTGLTGQEGIDSFITPAFLTYKAEEGKPTNELTKYRFNALTNYAFTQGPLKGFSLGGGVRWGGETTIGNPYIFANVNGVRTPVGLDLDHPYTRGAKADFDAWVGYTTGVWHDRARLSFQLNARNLTESGGLEAISKAGPTASGAVINQTYRIIPPRSFYLTTKLEF